MPLRRGIPPQKEKMDMTKVVCRPERKDKPGPKTVRVAPYERSKPKPIRKDCGK